jgi:hypothetical protein
MASSMHIFRVRDRNRPLSGPSTTSRKSFAEIGDELYEKRFTEYVTKLRKEAFVKIYDGELEKLEKQEKQEKQEKKS